MADLSGWLHKETTIVDKMVDSYFLLEKIARFPINSIFSEPHKHYPHAICSRANIPREKFSLPREGKPGDIDLLVIPVVDEKVRFDCSIALEIKIIRPTLLNPGRNANSLGGTQAIGLRDCGFPFVGLVHILLPEQSPTELHWSFPVIPAKDQKPSNQLFLTIDPFPTQSALRQKGRMEKLNLPTEIGLQTATFQLSENKSGMSDHRFPLPVRGFTKNPATSTDLISSIEQLFNNEMTAFSATSWMAARR